MNKARWYTSWLASLHRIGETLVENTSTIYHRRDSIAELPTNNYDPTLSENMRQSHVPAPASVSRHVPRKLSLVDRLERFDSLGMRPIVKNLSPPAPISPDYEPEPGSLPPLKQAGESRKAKSTLEKKVESWRTASLNTPSSLAAKGQTSLEPANMPNALPLDHIPLDPETDDTVSVLNLEEYTWSISSAGPQSHFEGSIATTSRLPSPDLGERHVEDCPETPSTITSWGPPSYPQSVSSESLAPSIDIAERFGSSRPITPFTATSWGAPSVLVLSPTESEHASIDLGERGMSSRPLTPSTATSWGAPLSYPDTPATPPLVSSPDMAARACEFPLSPTSEAWFPPSPQYDAGKNTRWMHSWPYHITRSVSPRVKRNAPEPLVLKVNVGYPNIVICLSSTTFVLRI